MVDWEMVEFDSPPQTLVSNAQVIIPHYLCHSQDMERNIEDVSAVCGKVYGHDSGYGVIIQMKKSRSDLPTIETKADFLH
jgi:hypothetical protein